MSSTRTSKGAFSPYAIAVMGLGVEWLLAGTALLLLFVSARGDLLTLLLTAIVGLPFLVRWLARCPRCGKPATMRDENVSKYEFGGKRRRPVVWPESKCSECGADLTSRLG